MRRLDVMVADLWKQEGMLKTSAKTVLEEFWRKIKQNVQHNLHP